MISKLLIPVKVVFFWVCELVCVCVNGSVLAKTGFVNRASILNSPTYPISYPPSIHLFFSPSQLVLRSRI